MSPLGRRVVDMNDCFYIVTSRFACKKCNTKFNGNNPILLQSLPYHIRQKFPAHLTKRSAMDWQVLNNLLTTVSESFGMSQSHRLLIENHARRYAGLRLEYFARFANSKSNSGLLASVITVNDFPEYRFRTINKTITNKETRVLTRLFLFIH